MGTGGGDVLGQHTCGLSEVSKSVIDSIPGGTLQRSVERAATHVSDRQCAQHAGSSVQGEGRRLHLHSADSTQRGTISMTSSKSSANGCK